MGVLEAGFWAAGVPVKLMGFAEFLLVPALEYPAPKLPVLRGAELPKPEEELPRPAYSEPKPRLPPLYSEFR